ncbi:pantothenate kinase [Pleurocapsales cyanobacterium LEGE 06147]|nr:pantothenate kinase [Pleurocapsales cyanobacterium LEGE 06147]
MPSERAISKLESQDWLCLAIGNSRLHWAWFKGEFLLLTWHSQHLTQPIVEGKFPREILPDRLRENELWELPLCLASVVPRQTAFWQSYSPLKQITLADIPLEGIYPTLGIDRALAIWGASNIYGVPSLVIDAGTALTFTGISDRQQLVGGAIAPGLRLHLQSLSGQTAALPEVYLPQSLPPRWALDTSQAIESGVIYTILASIWSFITDWERQFPYSNILFTGGDSELLWQYLQIQFPQIAPKTIIDTNLIFFGMKLVYFQSVKTR